MRMRENTGRGMGYGEWRIQENTGEYERLRVILSFMSQPIMRRVDSDTVTGYVRSEHILRTTVSGATF